MLFSLLTVVIVLIRSVLQISSSPPDFPLQPLLDEIMSINQIIPMKIHGEKTSLLGLSIC